MALAAGRPAAPAIREALPGLGARSGARSPSTGGSLTVPLRPPSPHRARSHGGSRSAPRPGSGAARRRMSAAPTALADGLGRAEPGSLLATELGGASGGLAVAAAVGVALAGGGRGVLLAELGAERPSRADHARLGRRPASWSGRCAIGDSSGPRPAGGSAGSASLAARRRSTELGAGARGREARGLDRPRSRLTCGGRRWTTRRCRCARASFAPTWPTDRALAALAVIELRDAASPVRVASRPLGLVASRRALAGLEIGGGAARRVARLARGLFGPHRGSLRRRTRAGAAADDRRGVRDRLLRRRSWRRSAAPRPAPLGSSAPPTWRRCPGPARCATTSRACSPRRGWRAAPPTPATSTRREYLARACAVAREAASATTGSIRPAAASVPGPRLVRAGPRPREVTASIDADALVPAGEAARESRGEARRSDRVRRGRGRGGAAGARRGSAGDGERRRILGPARLPAGQADAPGRRGGLRPPGRRRAPAPGIALVDQLRLPVRRRAGPAVRRSTRTRAGWRRRGTSLHRCATELDLGPPAAYAWLAAPRRPVRVR